MKQRIKQFENAEKWRKSRFGDASIDSDATFDEKQRNALLRYLESCTEDQDRLKAALSEETEFTVVCVEKRRFSHRLNGKVTLEIAFMIIQWQTNKGEERRVEKVSLCAEGKKKAVNQVVSDVVKQLKENNDDVIIGGYPSALRQITQK